MDKSCHVRRVYGTASRQPLTQPERGGVEPALGHRARSLFCDWPFIRQFLERVRAANREGRINSAARLPLSDLQDADTRIGQHTGA